jgi:hypothetical protein
MASGIVVTHLKLDAKVVHGELVGVLAQAVGDGPHAHAFQSDRVCLWTFSRLPEFQQPAAVLPGKLTNANITMASSAKNLRRVILAAHRRRSRNTAQMTVKTIIQIRRVMPLAPAAMFAVVC